MKTTELSTYILKLKPSFFSCLVFISYLLVIVLIPIHTTTDIKKKAKVQNGNIFVGMLKIQVTFLMGLMFYGKQKMPRLSLKIARKIEITPSPPGRNVTIEIHR